MKLSDFELKAYSKNTEKTNKNADNPASKLLSEQLKKEQKTVKPFKPERIYSNPVVQKANASKELIDSKEFNNSKNKKTVEAFSPVKEFAPESINNSKNANFARDDFSAERVADAVSRAPDLSDEQKTSYMHNAITEEAIKNGGLLKVPVSPPQKDGKDSVYRRVAKFLMLIGVDEAAKILPHLTPEQVEKIIPEITTIRFIDESEKKEIFEEFKNLTDRARENGGVNTARNILEKAFGSQKAGEVLEKAVPFKNGKPFNYLSEADPEKLEALLKDESAWVRALVCSNLPAKKAAAYIQNLPETEKTDLIVHLAKLKKMNPEVVARIDEAMQKKMNSLITQKSDSIDGKNILAGILKQMDSASEEKLLNQISSTDPSLSEDLRERLFTIDDIVNADDRFIQKKLQLMSDESIAFLIHSKKEDFRNKILSNVSQNRKAQILDEEERHSPMRKADVEKETSLFFAFMRRSWEEGKLVIKGRDDEVYV